MNIAVIGLGIIGGSFCKAIKKYTDNFVIGINRTQATAEKALEAGAIDKIGTPESLGECDIIILALYPQAAVDFIEKYGSYIKSGAIVTDSSGIKRAICPSLSALSKNTALYSSAVTQWQAKKPTDLMFLRLTCIRTQAT